ncbi:MAG TPA: class F sortase [Anaerolineaceae bacterium]|nr:class F sortase [Anaerolineaceae bacterium]
MKKFALLTLFSLAGLLFLFALQTPSPVASSPMGFTNTPLPTEAPTATPVPPPTPTSPPPPSRPHGNPPHLPATGNGAAPALPETLALGRVNIPALRLDATLLAVPWTGSDWDISNLGENVGWLQNTPALQLGENSVIVGHLDLVSGAAGPFAHLGHIAQGDEIQVSLGNRLFIYRVVEKFVVADSARFVTWTKFPSQLTLITCYWNSWDPDLMAYRKRLVITTRLERVEPQGHALFVPRLDQAAIVN